MKPYKNSDIDSGGCQNLKTNDGKTVEQVVIETWGETMPIEPSSKDDEYWDDYYDAVDNKMRAITRNFGW